VFARHLPVGDGDKFLGASPDGNAYIKDKYYIDTLTSNENVITFVCKSKFDIKQIVVPGRRYSLECQWAIQGRYLGSECDIGSDIAVATYPTCDGTLENCRERNNDARFGGFVSIPRRGFLIV